MTPQELAEDRNRWYKAHELLDQSLSERRKWLSQQSEEMRNDMQRRLKIVHANNKAVANKSRAK